MSSPATAAFLAAWRSYRARPVALCKIALTSPAALTLRFGTTELHTPDGNSWEMGLTCDVIRTRVGFLEAGVILTDTAFTLENRIYAGLSGARLGASLKSYQWQGATVTLYLWEQGLTAWADALQVFSGTIDSVPESTPTRVSFTLIQSREWNKAAPTLKVDKISYPYAPDVANGVAIPIVTGDHRALAMRTPWAATYTNKSKQEDVGGGSGVVPLILVDPGLGSAAVKLVAAGHECKDLLDRTNGYSTFVVAGDKLAPIETASGVTETLGASESYLTIDDDKLYAYYGVVPTDVWTGATPSTGTNPRRAMDVLDETSFATLNQTAVQSILNLTLPNIASLGRIDSVDVSMAFIGNAANTQNIQVYPRSSAPATGTVTSTVSTGTTPQVATGTWGAINSFWDANWNFGGATANQFSIVVDFAGAVANNKASILWVALRVKYRPQQSLVNQGFANNILFPWSSRKLDTYYQPPGTSFNGSPLIHVKQPEFTLQGQFYANIKGAPDDGSGTYTGSIAALIERVPDTLRYYLQVWGSVASGSVETGATSFGSFVLGRDTMRNAQPSDFKLATHVGNLTNIADILARGCEQSLTCLVKDRFTDKWLFHVWKPGGEIDYDLTLAWEDLADISVGILSDVSLSQGVRVKYGFDHFKGRTQFEAFLSPSGSTQGLTLPTTRDQRLTVTVGVNDKLDWSDGVVRAATLTPATYTAIDLAAHVQAQMRAATGDSIVAGHGFTVKAGYNNAIDFKVGASTYAATVAAAAYSPEGLCAAMVAAMNAAQASAVFGATYSHPTNKFTITSTASSSLLFATGASRTTSLWPLLGITRDYAAITTQASEFQRYGDRFWVQIKTAFTINMLWSSGANAATNCATLLGYAKLDSGLTQQNPASYSRGDRERAADTSATTYGPKAEQVITADWIRDENSAVQLRDRLFDMNSTPRTVLRAKSNRVPDLQAMRVIQLSSDVDSHVAFPRYGSDGSHALKAMRVIEVEQSMGPSFHTEFLAIEA